MFINPDSTLSADRGLNSRCLTMKKDERLNKKVYRLFKVAGNPRWMHRFGPKKFQTWILCLGLIVKQIYQLSYRRAMKFLDEYYHMKRIDRKELSGKSIQAITLVDVEKRKFISGCFFAKPHGEAKRIPALLMQSNAKPEVLLLDKGFDAEWLHNWLDEHGTFSIAPVRKNCRRGKHRRSE